MNTNKTIDVKSSTVIKVTIGDNTFFLSKDEATQLYYSLENELGIQPKATGILSKEMEDVIKNLPKYPQFPPTMPYPNTPGQDWAPNSFRDTYKWWEQYNTNNYKICMHDNCPSCKGKGIKSDGTPCVHNISCPCPKCTPYCSTTSNPVSV